MPTLYVFSGLPGTGKTTLAKRLSQHLAATYLRIDTVEQAMRDLCDFELGGEGYGLSYRIAEDNLRLGTNVVADSCNAIELSRREWESVAVDNNADFVNIEICCSDLTEHRRRVESRKSDIRGHQVPDWDSVANMEYHPWTSSRVVIDNALLSIEDSFIKLLNLIAIPNSA